MTDDNTPPADDAREALVKLLFDDDALYPLDGDGEYRFDVQAGVDAILAAFEVRPRGTVTDAEAKMQSDFEAIDSVREWWERASDSILERIKLDTTEDVMLYHDAVSVLVTARSVFMIAHRHVGNA